jgi:aminopeptidase N
MNRYILIQKLFALILILRTVSVTAFSADTYPRNPDIDILHYEFRITLTDSTDQITGLATITWHTDRLSASLDLDLTGLDTSGKGMMVEGVRAGDSPLSYLHRDNRIRIDLPDSLQGPGNFSVTVSYYGIPADGLIISKNKFGDRTFFGDNWPDRARNWLPCVDHPSDKATVDFYVTAPSRYMVVGNGYLAGEYPDTGNSTPGMKVTHWEEEVPLHTKVMVIGVADFAWSLAGFSLGVPVQSWVFAQNRDEGFTDYGPAPGILTFYQQLIGPYSFEKLANVQSKTIFGGMENSGCIFYYENSVTGRNNIQSLLAHEIAHQWFGDAVTEADWHHIWLSEGFATYLEACYADSMIQGRNLDSSMAQMRKAVIRFSKRAFVPVIDTTVTDNMKLLNTNSYQKGAWFLHMLRYRVGDRVFWSGIREFYRIYRNGNALTDDFRHVMESVSGQDLENFFRQWLELPGQPQISIKKEYDRRSEILKLTILQEGTPEPFRFPFSIRVEDQSGTISTMIRISVDSSQTVVTVPVDFEPDRIIPDPGVNLLFEYLSGK